MTKQERSDHFNRLYVEFKDRLYRLVLNSWADRNHADAEDLTQTAFLLVWQNLHQLRDKHNPWPWLCRVLWNAAQRWRQRRQKDPARGRGDIPDEPYMVDLAEDRKAVSPAAIVEEIEHLLAQARAASDCQRQYIEGGIAYVPGVGYTWDKTLVAVRMLAQMEEEPEIQAKKRTFLMAEDEWKKELEKKAAKRRDSARQAREESIQRKRQADFQALLWAEANWSSEQTPSNRAAFEEARRKAWAPGVPDLLAWYLEDLESHEHFARAWDQYTRAVRGPGASKTTSQSPDAEVQKLLRKAANDEWPDRSQFRLPRTPEELSEWLGPFGIVPAEPPPNQKAEGGWIRVADRDCLEDRILGRHSALGRQAADSLPGAIPPGDGSDAPT